MQPMKSVVTSFVVLVSLLAYTAYAGEGDPPTQAEWDREVSRAEDICSSPDYLVNEAINKADTLYESYSYFRSERRKVKNGLRYVSEECSDAMRKQEKDLLQRALIQGGEDHPKAYMEMVCDYGSPVYEIVGETASGPFEAYKRYKRIRQRVDSLKEKYPDYGHRAHLCVGGMMGLEGQLLDNYLRSVDEMKKMDYKSQENFLYSEYRQEQMKERTEYFRKALELDLEQPRGNRLTENELAEIGMGMYADPKHVEALARARIEDVADQDIIGAGTEHPQSREQYVIEQLEWAATSYAQHGQFEQAEKIIDEIDQHSQKGSEEAEKLREDLAEARESWPRRKAEREAKRERIREETEKFDPIIWAVAKSEDGEIPSDLVEEPNGGGGSAETKDARVENGTDEEQADVEPSTGSEKENDAASSVVIWSVVVAVLTFGIVSVVWMRRRR